MYDFIHANMWKFGNLTHLQHTTISLKHFMSVSHWKLRMFWCLNFFKVGLAIHVNHLAICDYTWCSPLAFLEAAYWVQGGCPSLVLLDRPGPCLSHYWGWESSWAVPLEEALYKCPQWMNERMNEWTNEWMNEWMNLKCTWMRVIKQPSEVN